MEEKNQLEVEIREGTVADLPETLELIHELARYEKMEQEVENNVQMMESDGFGVRPVFGSFVAIVQGKIIGAAIYYYRYSTWKGKRLYLEDLIVHEPMRGRGVGKKLFERVMRKVIDDGYTGMMWQVLDWNSPAIEFYKTFSTRFDPEWINCHLESSQIKSLLKD